MLKQQCMQTNNPRKIRHLEDFGVRVTGRIPCLVKPGEFSEGYLLAKGQRMDHMLELDTGELCYYETDIDSDTQERVCKPVRPVDEQTF